MVARNGQKLGAESVLSLSVFGSHLPEPNAESAPFFLSVRSAVNAHVRCYLQKANGRIVRIETSAAHRNSALAPGQTLTVPVTPVEPSHTATTRYSASILCLASTEDLEGNLREASHEPDGEYLFHEDFDQIYDRFRRTTKGNLVGATVQFDPAVLAQ